MNLTLSESETSVRHTPLYEEHETLGGKIVDFFDWALPIQYKGILEEHYHTRREVSLFDCSHMGEFLITGRESIEAFDYLVFSDVVGMRPGRCRYSSILNEHAGIVDDIVVFRLSEEEIYVVTNALPLPRVSAMIQSNVPEVLDVSDETAKIDIQGPLSRDVLLAVGLIDIGALRYFDCCRTRYQDTEIIISRAGYTGEVGYEIFIRKDLAVPLWRDLLAHDKVEPAGLGARDTLRIEMGYTLFGQDVDESKTTLEARMGRFVNWSRDFMGRDALCLRQEKHDYTVRTGIKSDSRRAPRAGFEVRHEGEVVGEVTSGTYGPSVGYGIGMAYVLYELSEAGNKLTVGPRNLPVETADFPFYKEGTCRKRFE